VSLHVSFEFKDQTLIQGFGSSDEDAVSLNERFPTFRRYSALTRETEWTADPEYDEVTILRNFENH